MYTKLVLDTFERNIEYSRLRKNEKKKAHYIQIIVKIERESK